MPVMCLRYCARHGAGAFPPDILNFITFAKEVMFLPDFVCLSVCQQDNSESYGRIFLKFSGNVGNGKNYQWFNFGGDPEGILDSGSLWNFVTIAFNGALGKPLPNRIWCCHLANNIALSHSFLGHIELGQCRKCNYSLKRTQNFRLFIFGGQAVSNQYAWRRSALSECFSSFILVFLFEI